MSDTEIVESSGEEEDDLVDEIDELEEEEVDEDLAEETNLSEGEVQTRMKNSGGTVVTVITRNVKVSPLKTFW